jgi:hypothetical protein
MSFLHPNLPPLPPRMKRLPVDARGYPVPWFVHWENGAPDFRVVERSKMYTAHREQLCWVCGEPLGKFLAFTVGPMCVINKTSGEPPSHRACAEFSARGCPFLTKPQVERREDNLPEGATVHPQMIMRNPGVTAVWITLSYKVVQSDEDHVVFRMGDALEVEYYCEGRPAIRAEVVHAMAAGLPGLREIAEAQGAEGVRELDELYAEALHWLPKVAA